jgi:hypothetical protein
MENITKSNIFTYITNLLSESEYYLNFNSIEDKDMFTNYIWKCYEDYTQLVNSKNISEKNTYKEKYVGFDMDYIFDDDLNNIERMKWCLFLDATEYSLRTHWLLRIGNGNNFKNSSKFNIWGITETTNSKHFKKLVKKGDILWFIISKEGKGQAIAFAEYVSHNSRTKTDMELGWELENNSSNWSTEINYKNLIDIEDNNYFTYIQGQNVNIRKYNEKCKVNLPHIFEKLSLCNK